MGPTQMPNGDLVSEQREDGGTVAGMDLGWKEDWGRWAQQETTSANICAVLSMPTLGAHHPREGWVCVQPRPVELLACV